MYGFKFTLLHVGYILEGMLKMFLGGILDNNSKFFMIFQSFVGFFRNLNLFKNIFFYCVFVYNCYQ